MGGVRRRPWVMPKRSKVKLYEQVRKAHERDGLSVRELARRFHVHRRDVRQALASAVPPERKAVVRAAPALDRWKPTIDGWLEADRTVPAQAASYRPAGVAASRRGTGRGGGRVDGASLRG